MDALELLVSLLSKTLNKSADDIRAIILKEGSDELNDNVMDELLKLDQQRVSGIQAKGKGTADNQYKRGQSEMTAKWTKGLRETFDLGDDVDDADLLEMAKAKIGTGATGDGAITEESVKRHPVYLALQKEKKASETKINNEWQTKFDKQASDFNHNSIKSSVESRALAIAKGLKPKLSEDAEKADRQLRMIIRALDGYEFEIDGDSFLVKKDGKAYEDSHGHLISFEDMVKKETTALYDLDKSGSGSGTGNGNGFGDGIGKIKVPKDNEELAAALKAEPDSEKRAAISTAFRAAQKEQQK